jgi:hypothetical protein
VVPECPEAVAGAGTVVLDTTAVLEGQPVRVVVLDGGAGGRQVVVTDAACTVVLRQAV